MSGVVRWTVAGSDNVPRFDSQWCGSRTRSPVDSGKSPLSPDDCRHSGTPFRPRDNTSRSSRSSFCSLRAVASQDDDDDDRPSDGSAFHRDDAPPDRISTLGVRDGLIARQHHGPWHVATRQIRFRRPRQLVRVRLDGGGHFRVRTRRQVDGHSWRRRWNRDVLHVPVFLGSARRVHAGRYGVLLLYRLRLVTWVIFFYYRLNKLIVFGPLKII